MWRPAVCQQGPIEVMSRDMEVNQSKSRVNGSFIELKSFAR